MKKQNSRALLPATLAFLLLSGGALATGCAQSEPSGQAPSAGAAQEQSADQKAGSDASDGDADSGADATANKKAQQDENAAGSNPDADAKSGAKKPADQKPADQKAAEKKAEQKAAAQKAADKKKADAKKPAEKGGVSDPVSSTPKRTWVEPVYKTVHHKEQGHYETQTQKVQKVKCNCGKLFDTSSAWKAHQDAFLKYMRENVDPNYTCKGDHLSHYVTVEESKQVYVVDKEAYDEKVLVKKGYWK